MPSLREAQIKEIVAGLRAGGQDVGLRDVMYAVLASILGEDRRLAFRALYGDSPEVPFEKYDHLEKVNRVEAAVCKALYAETVDAETGEVSPQDDISFDELKQGLIDDMRALEELRDSRDPDSGVPLLDAKEMAQVVARIADIRVKLTEKFGTTERVVEQRVVVHQKYDSVCPYCHHEIAIPPGHGLADKEPKLL